MANLVHITKTSQPFGVVVRPNTSAKRRSPLPLLVVHSGRTTIGRSAVLRMSSSGRPLPGCGRTFPVDRTISRSDAVRKPVIGARGTASRVAGEATAAHTTAARTMRGVAIFMIYELISLDGYETHYIGFKRLTGEGR